MRYWLDPQPVTVPADLRDFVGGHPLVAELLARRGITDVAAARAFLDPDAYNPSPPDAMPGMAEAVARVTAAIRHKERLCVWGDFDVDGQTSTTLLVAALRDLGADVIYHIPVRETESHGVKVPFLQPELDKGVRVLLTCDTGIDAHEAVAYANARGVSVVITDHHELPPELPQAHAIVNPHLLPAGHPLGTLPGVGVAYKLTEALYAWAGRPDDAAQYLDLVALGLVADVAELSGDARYLLQRGLRALRTTSRLGLQELMRWANLVPARVSEEDIGFGLGPRLNALGRLDDANVIVEFLTTTDLTRARILASQLEAHNARRKLLCDQVFAAAQAQLEENPALLDSAALVLGHATWPTGVVGVVANRLVDLYQRPVILLNTPADGPARGSARSVEGCHITDAIAAHQELLLSFGGHAMAAGVSLLPENLPTFQRRLSESVAAQLSKISAPSVLTVDSYVPLSALSLELVAQLERLAPFGSGNPRPLLATQNLTISGSRSLGREGRHLLSTVEDAYGDAQQVVWWHWDNAALPDGAFDLAYSIRVNTYRGEPQLQIVWEAARAIVSVTAPEPAPARQLQIVDYRREPRPATLVKPLLERKDVQIWCEGSAEGVSGKTRYELQPASVLAMWTLPPGPEELSRAFEIVAPDTLYLFQIDPGLSTAEAFLKFLIGLVKHALHNRAGELQVATLAGLMGHREATVRLGLTWLEARGFIQILQDEGGDLQVTAGEQHPVSTLDQIGTQLQALLDETAAYRAYLARVSVADLRRFIGVLDGETLLFAP